MSDHIGEVSLPPNPRVALVGDSVLAGLGVHGRSYGRIVAKQLHAAQTLQLARSTHTVLDALEKLDRLKEFQPDLVIVSVGGSDHLVHAGRMMQRAMDRFAPKSWQGVEGLEPRPWFVGTKYEQLRQRAGTAAKVATKHAGILFTGGYQRVPCDKFSASLSELLTALESMACSVVVVGLHDTDPRLFPRSAQARVPYDDVIAKEVASRSNVLLVEVKELVRKWDDYLPDHAHLNETGHGRVAEALVDALLSQGRQGEQIVAPVGPSVDA